MAGNAVWSKRKIFFFLGFVFFFNTDTRKVKLIWKYAQNFPPEPHGVSFMHVSIWIILINEQQTHSDYEKNAAVSGAHIYVANWQRLRHFSFELEIILICYQKWSKTTN